MKTDEVSSQEQRRHAETISKGFPHRPPVLRPRHAPHIPKAWAGMENSILHPLHLPLDALGAELGSLKTRYSSGG